MTKPEAENLTAWLKDLCAVINEELRLAPVKVVERKVEQLFDQVDGDSLLQVAETLGVAQSEPIRELAKQIPDLADRVRTEEGHRAIKEWSVRNTRVVARFGRQLALLWKQSQGTGMISFPEEDTGGDSKGKRGKRGSLPEADLEREVWRALKCLNDPYELDKGRLARLKEVEALAKRCYADNPCAGGEVLADILSSCVN
jgi:hypothetical protein